ncbi:MAG TPA: acetamidase/formamidase family protein [Pseudolabrys sp.]|jgi:acetamidase/formamidase|nr:acetamidase/formamidase family protein [Pseudolabrys sp.]HZZ77880.1 acetamidase/formamidase family protein [Gemmataceae bacterium]
MKHLTARSDTVHIGFHDGALEPVLQVDDGDEVLISTVSAHPDHDVPAEWLPPDIHDIVSRGKRGDGPHIMTGPIAVRGARPGQILQVDIIDIRLTQPYGYNTVRPLKGMFGTETPTLKTTIIPIDIERGSAEVAPGVHIPTRPFFGQMGVAPPREWGRLDSRPPNRYGGNIDNKELVAGTRLLLPIWVEGGLFSVGDGHGAQGDGEINQTAIETSLQGHFRLSLRDDLKLEWPMAVTPEHLVTMAFHEDLDDAARIAMRSMIGVLERQYAMAFHDAYRLCSVAADMRVTQFVNGNRGIHVMLAKTVLAQLPAKIDFFDSLPVKATERNPAA